MEEMEENIEQSLNQHNAGMSFIDKDGEVDARPERLTFDSKEKGVRPPNTIQDHGRVILHFDIDCFYAQACHHRVEAFFRNRDLHLGPVPCLASFGYQYWVVTDALGLIGKERDDPNFCILFYGGTGYHYDQSQVEQVLNPLLKGKPVGIRQKYLLVTCNYEARRLGVKKMEGVVEAKKRCPSLVVLDGEDLSRYREASESIFAFVAGVCGPLVQRLGLDDIFADVTSSVLVSQLHKKGPDLPNTARGDSPEEYPDSAVQSNTHNMFGNLGQGTDVAPGAEAGSWARAREETNVDIHKDESPYSALTPLTGLVYHPGSGGTLLEAQTGQYISLSLSEGGGGGREGRGEGSGEMPLLDEGGGACLGEEEAGSEGVLGKGSTKGSSVDGRAHEGGPVGSALIRGGKRRLGECGRGEGCGCLERLALGSTIAQSVRRDLKEKVSGMFASV